MDFIHYKQALEAIYALAGNFQTENMSLKEVFGKYVAIDMFAPIDVPAFSNSAMDGFGFSDEELIIDKIYPVTGEIKAGSPSFPPVSSGQAIRIFTGAPVPEGVKTVIMQEQCTYDDSHVTINKGPVEINMNIRHRGSQTKKGSLLVSKGTRITPGLMALLAGFGLEEIPVYKLPGIGIIITGDELVTAGQPLQAGQIYESNGVALAALLESMRIQPQFVYKVNDDVKRIENIVKESLQTCDILIMTGGVSVGDYDYVQPALFANEVEKVFYKIRQKPGKPFFLGKKNQQIVFALPGNPASVFTCFHIYVMPFLMHLLSGGNIFIQKNKAVLNHDFSKKKGLTHFYKCIVDDGKISILAGQESYRMDSFREANGFCIVEEDVETLHKNDELEYINICQ